MKLRFLLENVALLSIKNVMKITEADNLFSMLNLAKLYADNNFSMLIYKKVFYN